MLVSTSVAVTVYRLSHKGLTGGHQSLEGGDEGQMA